MFTGVGGFEVGLKQAGEYFAKPTTRCSKTGKHGSDSKLKSKIDSRVQPTAPHYQCIGFSETDKFARQVLAHRFPGVRNFGDATAIEPKTLPDFDLLCAGFPCQAFSIAGRRQGLEDTRGTLFFEIVRILETKRPQIIFLENVKGLLCHEKGKTFNVIIQALVKLGYDIQWMVLDSKFFAVPQHRERVYIVGNLGATPRPQILPFSATCRKFVQSSTEKEKPSQKENGENVTSINSVPKCASISVDRHSHEGTRGNGLGARIYYSDGISSTVTNKGAEFVAVLDAGSSSKKSKPQIRRMTPRECERLQGFPDDWTQNGIDENGKSVMLSDTQRYKQMGNAVTVNVIESLGKMLLQNFSKFISRKKKRKK